MNDVYWRIYLCSDGKYRVVCMQWFDEDDYYEEKFLTDKDGNKYIFHDKNHSKHGFISGEKIAKEFLNKVMKAEFIHEDDITANNKNMYKIPKEEW